MPCLPCECAQDDVGETKLKECVSENDGESRVCVMMLSLCVGECLGVLMMIVNVNQCEQIGLPGQCETMPMCVNGCEKSVVGQNCGWKKGGSNSQKTRRSNVKP